MHTAPRPDAQALAALEQPLIPTTVVPAAERESMVWIPSHQTGGFVAVPRSTLPEGYLTPAATAPVHLPTTPAPGPALDPAAQRMAAAGIGGGALAAGTGWGVAQVVGALAGLGSGVALLVGLLLVARLARPRQGDTHITVTNHTSWWGRSTTRL